VFAVWLETDRNRLFPLTLGNGVILAGTSQRGSFRKFCPWQVGFKNPVAEIIDPVRELKPAFKMGFKGGMTHTPLLKLDLTPVQDLLIRLLMLPVGRAGAGARGGTD
jgi:hypothetical protein